jgi:hypothetical protein
MKPIKAGAVVKRSVTGPFGTFEIDFQDDGSWSVEKIFGDDISNGFTRKSAIILIGGSQLMSVLPTAPKAWAFARAAAGFSEEEISISLPAKRPMTDRRGLVAHSRALS